MKWDAVGKRDGGGKEFWRWGEGWHVTWLEKRNNGERRDDDEDVEEKGDDLGWLMEYLWRSRGRRWKGVGV